MIIKKGDVVKIMNMPMSIHNDRVKGKIGIVIDNGNLAHQYRLRQFAVSIPTYNKVLYIIPMYMEKINEAG